MMSEHERSPVTGDINGFGPRRRSPVRFLLSVGIAVGIVAALYLYQPDWFTASRLVTAGPSPTPTAGPAPTPTPAPKPKPPSYPYIGESQTSVDNIKITVTGVTYTPGGDGRVANRGDVFAIVTLRIDNEQGKDWPFQPNVNCQVQTGCNFYVQDDQGEKNPPIPFDPYHTALRAVVLRPGGHHEGSYTFEVPARDKDTEHLILLWYPNPFLAPDTLYHWILINPPHHGR